MKNVILLLVLSVLTFSCGNRRLSETNLQHKIDSVRQLEKRRLLQVQGIEQKETSPFQMFYDSLNMQALPLEYTAEYMQTLPGYKLVPEAIVKYLELEGRQAPKAMSLPEAVGTRLVLLAADTEDGEYELWLYSLDADCYPVDKLMVYEPQHFLGRRLRKDSREPYFSITSNYEINIQEYADEYDAQGQMSTYVIDDSCMFVEKPLVPQTLIP